MGEEKAFENKIKDFLTENGAFFVKYFANRNTKAGIPDILACVNGYFVGIEVKATKGVVKDLQIHKAEKIRESGGFSYIVYPTGYLKLCNIILNLKHGYFNTNEELILK